MSSSFAAVSRVTVAWCAVADFRRVARALCWLTPWLLLAGCSPRSAQPPASQAGPAAVEIAGGDGGRLPIAGAADEHFDAAALAEAGTAAAAEGAQALLVARHGHLVLEAYAHGGSAEAQVDGGEFSAALLALAAGLARTGNTAAAALPTAWDAAALQSEVERAGGDYVRFLSQQLWQPLNAAPARIRRAADGALHADCCVSARASDWLRVGLLLAQQGSFEGEQIVPAAWVAHLQRPLPGDATRGLGLHLAPQGFAARNVIVLRGPGHTRLWLVPALQLAVLRVEPQGQGEWSEPAALDPFIRAVNDRDTSGAGADLLDRLVPGH